MVSTDVIIGHMPMRMIFKSSPYYSIISQHVKSKEINETMLSSEKQL